MPATLKAEMAAFDAVRLQCTIHEERITITQLQAEKLHAHGVAHPGEECYTLADGKGWLDVEAVLGGGVVFEE